MVIPLLGVKTRCADKSTAEHYEHTYIWHAMNKMTNAFRYLGHVPDFIEFHLLQTSDVVQTSG